MKKQRKIVLGFLMSFLAVMLGFGMFYVMKEKIITLALLQARTYDVHGVDVSHYQGTIDWQVLSQENIEFAFIKATEGSSHVDTMFFANFEGASQTELCIGAYHFFSFESSGENQANHYISVVGDLTGKMPPIVDFEFYSNQGALPSDDEVRYELQELLTRLEEQYGVKPIIYTTMIVYQTYVEDYFLEYPIWIRNVYYKTALEAGRDWTFWQYQDNARLEGYYGEEERIDLNVFNGSIEDLHNMKVE